MIIANVLGYEVSIAHLILYFTFLTGFHYNVENIYYGFMGAKDKSYALKCLVPYIQIYVLVVLTSYSQFFNTAAFLFLAAIGIWQTYVTAFLNLSSIASLTVTNFYYDPIIYSIILACDVWRIFPATILIASYGLLILVICIKYARLMVSVIN